MFVKRCTYTWNVCNNNDAMGVIGKAYVRFDMCCSIGTRPVVGHVCRFERL